MSRHIPRVYLDQALQAGMALNIDGNAAHHLLRVLRIKTGAELVLFNGQGGEYPARVTQADRRILQVEVEAQHECNRESKLHITLLQGIARGERMDYSIGKAVELGVSHIQPLQLARSQGMDAERLAKKQAHWRAIVQSAAEQSGRTAMPEVADVCKFEDWLEEAVKPERLLMLHPGGSDSLGSLSNPESRPASLALLIGPEGGLSDEEVAMAVAAGFDSLSLGPRILRTETAGMAALALLQAQWGDLLG